MIIYLPFEVPDWVEFVTVDPFGVFEIWNKQPVPLEDMWHFDMDDPELSYLLLDVCTIGYPKDWTKELYKVEDGRLVRVEQ